MHRDSLGSKIEIKPGAVNWMTAGKGVVHSERTPTPLKDKEKTLHGLQIWVALPKELEQSEPSFYHIEEIEIPQWKENNLSFKLIAGKAFGKESPVPVHSDLYFMEIKSSKSQIVDIGEHLYGESALYILDGSVNDGGENYEPKQILIAKDASLCEFEMKANSTVYIFGGEPFEEKRFIDWNFVSSNKQTIEQAKEDWKAQRFPKVPGETEFVPLPEPKF